MLHVGLDGYRRLTVALPDHAVFETVGEMAERGERNGNSALRGNGEALDLRRIDSVVLRRPQINTDELVALAELRDGIARQRHLQVVGDFLRSDVEPARLRLVHFEVNGALGGLVPVELHVVRVRVLPHHLRQPARPNGAPCRSRDR